MFERPPYLIHVLHACEIIALIAGLIYFKSIKNTYWKWFVYYLVIIVTYELISSFLFRVLKIDIVQYMSFFVLPFEFIFFFWLFAYQSLKQNKLFGLASGIVLLSLLIEVYYANLKELTIQSINYIVGSFLLMIFVFLEFIKQIKSDDIIYFKNNKMFYINIGVLLFYIGNLPFFGLYFLIMKVPSIWNAYYYYFMVSNSIMYLLFAASFIWGKHRS